MQEDQHIIKIQASI